MLNPACETSFPSREGARQPLTITRPSEAKNESHQQETTDCKFETDGKEVWVAGRGVVTISCILL